MFEIWEAYFREGFFLWGGGGGGLIIRILWYLMNKGKLTNLTSGDTR